MESELFYAKLALLNVSTSLVVLNTRLRQLIFWLYMAKAFRLNILQGKICSDAVRVRLSTAP